MKRQVPGRKAAYAALALLCASLFLYRMDPLPDPLFPCDYSTVVLDENGRYLRVFLNTREQWHFPPDHSRSIPDKLRTTVLQSEDRYFYRHPGVNPFSVLRALYQNCRHGKIVSGASTLTMQVARLMYPKPRTLWNKCIEACTAIRIEMKYPKGEILRLYLDHAPFGGNIVGCQAASLFYFGIQSEQLTWAQAATLAVLPNAPGLISPFANHDELIAKRNRLLRRLLEQKIITEEECELASLEPATARERRMPLIAPHLSQQLKDSYGGTGAAIRTTVTVEHQRYIEELVRGHALYLQTKGVHNCAALVAETRSGKVRAYVGSNDFLDAEHCGQVDGVRSPRSTGSILKPFLYALCMDGGIIHPRSMIRDIPSSYGSYSPANASNTFSGLVSANDALIQSLNVPAVRLLYAYGLHSFYSFLKSAGVTTLFRSPEDYGLPLVLGGAEATLFDLAALYRALGRSGLFGPLRVTEAVARPRGRANPGPNAGTDQPAGSHHDVRLISDGACYLTLDILKELKRPGAEYYWEQYQNQWPIAWKTGTSYGQRDAWAVGVSPQWTIAVWAGNYDGEPNANITGASCAAPLLFDIFNYLPKDALAAWFKKPEQDLVPITLCLESGYIAGEHCPHPVQAEAPSRMKPLKRCPYHRTIFVSEDEQCQVCSLCWESGRYKEVKRLVLPPDIAQLLRENGQAVDFVPPHNRTCVGTCYQNPIQIVYPGADARLWIPRDLDGRLQRVAAKAAHGYAGSLVYWYMDHVFLGSSFKHHMKALDVSGGWHVLEVVDQEGNRDRKRFFVDLHTNR